jgi:predicted naringenin-chalcone synthase
LFKNLRLWPEVQNDGDARVVDDLGQRPDPHRLRFGHHGCVAAAQATATTSLDSEGLPTTGALVAL